MKFEVVMFLSLVQYVRFPFQTQQSLGSSVKQLACENCVYKLNVYIKKKLKIKNQIVGQPSCVLNVAVLMPNIPSPKIKPYPKLKTLFYIGI